MMSFLTAAVRNKVLLSGSCIYEHIKLVTVRNYNKAICEL
jgi:hypothetical protein